ncbi:MAG: SPOR domain-containing protein [Prevotella sp.]|nr:SPOR domain-containing protein [Prevotella sp.]MBR2035480.1 SPOR domain-containing protein [Prevotella sp.]MBR6605525.1 SPOR domain-containing protein [Prevotella sp.]MBR7171213.1 SPOR domain-containing protein [Prevotella sp.]
MKQFVVLITLFICSLSLASAQSFMERLKMPGRDNAKVTVHQDAAIDELVNGRPTIIVSNSTKAPAKKNVNANNNAKAEKEVVSADQTEPDYHNVPVIRKTYKTNGYRVQVFAGGNSRSDRQKAERTGNTIKINFPDEPVYVHFYSPRWICRVGNYRTYEEAHQILTAVKQLGYEQATIVKGKITVQF